VHALAAAQGKGLSAEESEDALCRVFVWLRYSASRHLTWQRNYNTQPRILGAAQERLTNAIAAVSVGRLGGRTNGWADGRVDDGMDGRAGGWVVGRIDGQGGQADGRMMEDGWPGQWINRQTDGQMKAVLVWPHGADGQRKKVFENSSSNSIL
jgi:hypothetical protein